MTRPPYPRRPPPRPKDEAVVGGALRVVHGGAPVGEGAPVLPAQAVQRVRRARRRDDVRGDDEGGAAQLGDEPEADASGEDDPVRGHAPEGVSTTAGSVRCRPTIGVAS